MSGGYQRFAAALLYMGNPNGSGTNLKVLNCRPAIGMEEGFEARQLLVYKEAPNPDF